MLKSQLTSKQGIEQLGQTAGVAHQQPLSSSDPWLGLSENFPDLRWINFKKAF